MAFVAVVATACGPHVGAAGTDVGAACTSNAQCASVCLQNNGNWPGGMCTILCNSDVQCPKGSVCVSSNGGVCAVSCTQPADCAGFGRGFTCDAADHVTGGQALVCRVP
ncbi:MAG TPA: hypothetical protein VF945_21645 [Polyangia bacterium]